MSTLFIMKIISERLRKLRAERGLTALEVCEPIGMSETVYRRYEVGMRVPRIEQLVLLADFFDVSLDYLVGRSDDPKRCC